MSDPTKSPFDQGDEQGLEQGLEQGDGDVTEMVVIDQAALDGEPDAFDLGVTGSADDLAPGAASAAATIPATIPATMEMAVVETAPSSAVPVRMVACPQCGTPNPDVHGRRAADGFCSECDFPLFFAGGVVETVETSTDGQDRLPGVAGRDRRTWIPCPACGELNPRDGLHCLRCGAVLHPPVEPEPEPLPEPEFLTPEPVVLPAPPCRRWPMFVFGFAAGWAAMLVAFVIIDRWG